MFIYFDFNSVNRFATAGVVDSRFEELFGCRDFLNAPASGVERQKYLHDLYERQLRTECDFAHVRSFAMINSSGHIGNYLFFCTRNRQAFDRMKQAMWKLDPTGEYRFEDNLAGQSILFGDEADTGPLQTALAGRFKGQTVDISEVINFVIDDTPFHSGQVKQKTLAVMQRENRVTSPNQRRRNQFPEGTLIAFL